MEPSISGGPVRGLWEWRVCVKESWEMELGNQSRVIQGAVGQTGGGRGILHEVHAPQVAIIS